MRGSPGRGTGFRAAARSVRVSDPAAREVPPAARPPTIAATAIAVAARTVGTRVRVGNRNGRPEVWDGDRADTVLPRLMQRRTRTPVPCRLSPAPCSADPRVGAAG